MGIWQWLSIRKDKNGLYAYLPYNRPPFRSTAFSVVDDKNVSLVIFDRPLSFVPHLKHVRNKGLEALNILKVIGNNEWGVDRNVLLHLYRSLVRSKLDYGCRVVDFVLEYFELVL